MKKNLKAIFNNLECSGYMEILSRSGKSAYVIWTFYHRDNKLIASFSNNYFLGKENVGDTEIYELVKNQILKYRIGREKPFSKIEFT